MLFGKLIGFDGTLFSMHDVLLCWQYDILMC